MHLLLSLGVIREAFSSRNVMVLTITQTFFMFTAFLWWPYWSLFILELGATKELLGMLQMIETVTQLFCQLPGGILADRFGRRRLIVYSSIFRVASPIIYLFSTHWTHIAPGLFLSSLAMLGLPAMNALMAESLPIVSRGAGLSAYRTVTWMPMIITGLIGGIIMDTYGVVQGVKLCVLATLVASVFTVLMRWRFITETLATTGIKEEEEKNEASRNTGFLQELATMPKEIWVLTVVAALSGLAMRMVMSFMVVYAVEVVGLTNTQWGIIGTAVSLVSTVLTIPGGMLADRIGRKPCITVSRILSPLSTLGYTYSQNFWQVFLVRVVGGVASGFGGTVWGLMGGPVWQALVADITPPERRGKMIGVIGTIAGIVSTPASWVGGYMYDNISPALPFQTSFVINIAGTIIFVTLLKEPKKSE